MDMVGIGGVELLIGMLFALAIPLILLFFVVKWAVASGMKNALASRDPEGRAPREILDERYAKGEIGREEYERMRRDIEG